MSFIQNAHNFFLLDAPDVFDLLLQLPLGVAPIEAGFQPQLVQQALVEPPWRQL